MYTSLRILKHFACALSLAGGLILPAAWADHSGQAPEESAVSRPIIRQVQRQLKNRGFYSGAIDGMYGNQTRMAVQKFQRSENLVETGTLNDATLKSLGVEPARRETQGEASRSIDESGQTPSALIRSAQLQLKRDGYYQGEADGTIGPETRHALRQYQQDQDLRATGELNRQTLHSLGVNR